MMPALPSLSHAVTASSNVRCCGGSGDVGEVSAAAIACADTRTDVCGVRASTDSNAGTGGDSPPPSLLSDPTLSRPSPLPPPPAPSAPS